MGSRLGAVMLPCEGVALKHPGPASGWGLVAPSSYYNADAASPCSFPMALIGCEEAVVFANRAVPCASRLAQIGEPCHSGSAAALWPGWFRADRTMVCLVLRAIGSMQSAS